MKLEVLVEDARQDAGYRYRAQKAFNDLLKLLKRNGEGVFDSRGYLPASRLNHPENISIQLLPKGMHGNADAGVDPEKRIVYLYVDMSQPIIPQIESQKMAVSFVHEFVHIMDSERFSVMSPTGRLGDADYFNDPSELNAFYQDALTAFELYVSKNRNNPDMKRIASQWSRDFESWLKFFLGLVDKDFKNFLRLKNDRKLKKRAYGFWSQNIQGKY